MLSSLRIWWQTSWSTKGLTQLRPQRWHLQPWMWRHWWCYQSLQRVFAESWALWRHLILLHLEVLQRVCPTASHGNDPKLPKVYNYVNSNGRNYQWSLSNHRWGCHRICFTTLHHYCWYWCSWLRSNGPAWCWWCTSVQQEAESIRIQRYCVVRAFPWG